MREEFCRKHPSMREEFDVFYPSSRDFCHFLLCIQTLFVYLPTILNKDHDIMEKAFIKRFVLDFLKLRKLHVLSRT